MMWVKSLTSCCCWFFVCLVFILIVAALSTTVNALQGSVPERGVKLYVIQMPMRVKLIFYFGDENQKISRQIRLVETL